MRGRVVFAGDAIPFSHANLLVSVQDTTYTDAPSRTVDSAVVADVSIARPSDVLGFTIDTDSWLATVSPGTYLTLRVIVDVDRDGRLGVGDYVNTAAVVVAAARQDEPVDIVVHRVA